MPLGHLETDISEGVDPDISEGVVAMPRSCMPFCACLSMLYVSLSVSVRALVEYLGLFVSV